MVRRVVPKFQRKNGHPPLQRRRKCHTELHCGPGFADHQFRRSLAASYPLRAGSFLLTASATSVQRALGTGHLTIQNSTGNTATSSFTVAAEASRLVYRGEQRPSGTLRRCEP